MILNWLKKRREKKEAAIYAELDMVVREWKMRQMDLAARNKQLAKAREVATLLSVDEHGNVTTKDA